MLKNMPISTIQANHLYIWKTWWIVSDVYRAVASPGVTIWCITFQRRKYVLWLQAVYGRLSGGQASADGWSWAIQWVDQDRKRMGEFQFARRNFWSHCIMKFTILHKRQIHQLQRFILEHVLYIGGLDLFNSTVVLPGPIHQPRP